jgi:hypothetical protein
VLRKWPTGWVARRSTERREIEGLSHREFFFFSSLSFIAILTVHLVPRTSAR